MVAAVDLGVDLSVGQLGLQAVAHQEVVDAPTRILFAGLEAVAPPRIDTFQVGVEEAPCIGKS